MFKNAVLRDFLEKEKFHCCFSLFTQVFSVYFTQLYLTIWKFISANHSKRLNPLFTKKLIEKMGIEEPKLAFEDDVMEAYKQRLDEFRRL